MSNMDKKIKEIKDMQAELDRRTAIEEQVLKLFAEGKFEEGKELLESLDHSDVESVQEVIEECGKKKHTPMQIKKSSLQGSGSKKQGYLVLATYFAFFEFKCFCFLNSNFLDMFTTRKSSTASRSMISVA